MRKVSSVLCLLVLCPVLLEHGSSLHDSHTGCKQAGHLPAIVSPVPWRMLGMVLSGHLFPYVDWLVTGVCKSLVRLSFLLLISLTLPVCQTHRLLDRVDCFSFVLGPASSIILPSGTPGLPWQSFIAILHHRQCLLACYWDVEQIKTV